MYKDNDLIARRERQYLGVIRYLNLAAEQGHTSEEVFLQQARELSYCKGVENLSERDYLLFLDFAFFKALKALYPKALLIKESGIFSSMSLPFDQSFGHSQELEAQFDQASFASQARQALKEQCEGLRAMLREIQVKAQELKARNPESGDKNDQAYKAFKRLSKELDRHINAYEAEQNQHINVTGRLNPEFNVQYKAQCLASIQVAAPVLSQHRGWGQILEKVVGAVRSFFGFKSENQPCLTVFATQSASTLQTLSQVVSRSL